LRYLGHWEKFKAFSELGLFDENPIIVNGNEIIPREVYHNLLAPKISTGDNRDLGIIKIFAEGIKKGKSVKTIIELIDYFDENTGFTAMQRLTGWHASTIANLSAEDKVTKGAVSVSKAVSGKTIIDELRKRGIKIIISEK
jgi:lysine 6-dehydrogenase